MTTTLATIHQQRNERAASDREQLANDQRAAMIELLAICTQLLQAGGDKLDGLRFTNTNFELSGTRINGTIMLDVKLRRRPQQLVSVSIPWHE